MQGNIEKKVSLSKFFNQWYMVFKNRIKQLKCFKSQYSSHLLNASNVSLLGNRGWTI